MCIEYIWSEVMSDEREGELHIYNSNKQQKKKNKQTSERASKQ